MFLQDFMAKILFFAYFGPFSECKGAQNWIQWPSLVTLSIMLKIILGALDTCSHQRWFDRRSKIFKKSIIGTPYSTDTFPSCSLLEVFILKYLCEAKLSKSNWFPNDLAICAAEIWLKFRNLVEIPKFGQINENNFMSRSLVSQIEV